MISLLNYLPILLKGLLFTLEISIISVVLGMSLGILVGLLQTHKKVPKWIQMLCKGYVSIIRGTPIFVQLLLMYFGIPQILPIELSAFQAGIITLTLNAGGYVAEIVRAGLNAVPKGQWEACKALGYSDIQTLKSVIMPQAMMTMLPALGNELIIQIKESSVLMILGVPELTKVSKELASSELKPMEIYLLAGALYYVLTGTVSALLKVLERRTYVVKSI